MKRKHLLINIIFFYFLLLQTFVSGQIISNGGLETWATGTSGYLDPVGWITDNAAGYHLVLQAPGRTGNYSAHLVSILDGSNYDGGSIYFYYSGALKPLVLSGYWKGNFTTTANWITIAVTVADASSATIGSGAVYSPTSTNITSWLPFNCTINYTSSNAPVTTVLVFNLLTTAAITDGYLDDLSLTYITGIGEIQTVHLLGASLNYDFQSGNYFLNTDLFTASSFDVNIYDVSGRKVYSKNYNLPDGHREIPVLTQQLPRGIYLCRILGDKMDKTIKFIK